MGLRKLLGQFKRIKMTKDQQADMNRLFRRPRINKLRTGAGMRSAAAVNSVVHDYVTNPKNKKHLDKQRRS